MIMFSIIPNSPHVVQGILLPCSCDYSFRYFVFFVDLLCCCFYLWPKPMQNVTWNLLAAVAVVVAVVVLLPFRFPLARLPPDGCANAPITIDSILAEQLQRAVELGRRQRGRMPDE